MAFFRRKKSVNITDSDPTYKVIYLGNVLTLLAKGDACAEKPLQTLWKNYTCSQRKDIKMKVTICNSGLKAETTEHGLTEYWAHRITFCGSHPDYPKLFAWIYRHEGKRLKPELRFHAVLCTKAEKVQQMVSLLQQKVVWALNEFKRDKISKQNARRLHEILAEIAPTVCKRRQILSTGQNFRPPLEVRSKSSPRLLVIEEEEGTFVEEEEEENDRVTTLKRQSSDGSASFNSASVDSAHVSEPTVNEEEEDEETDVYDDYDDNDSHLLSDESPSWSVNSSPAGSWNVKRRASSTTVNNEHNLSVKEMNHSSTAISPTMGFDMQELRKTIEETSSVESGYEEPRLLA